MMFRKSVSELPEEAAEFLQRWIHGDCSVLQLHGDASARAYYRVVAPSGERYILAYYPQSVRESVERYVKAHEALSKVIRVPVILQRCDYAIGQADVGDASIFDILRQDRETAIPMYERAVDILVDLQKAPPEARTINPPFSAAKFYEELEMTMQFYVEQLVGDDSRENHGALLKIFKKLSDNLAGHPYVLCHRDYHGQNIYTSGGQLYVIDFQDVRMGPDTYDLASLLRDRGAAELLGHETEENLVEKYAIARAANSSLRKRYLETLLQRSIKAIGTFAKQAITRGRMHYLDYIPPTLRSIEFALGDLDEYRAIRELFPMRFDLH